MRSSDAELVGRVQSGETTAFTELVERYRDVVFGTAYHYLGNFEDAQDAAQEAFIHAYRHLDQLRDPERFAPWLRRTTTNLCAGLMRQRGLRTLSLDALADHDFVAGEAHATPGPGMRADEQVERMATRMVVREALGHLSEKVRLTVTLYYISGYSHAEIARFLEIPVNTVRSRLQLAKRQLREEMMTMLNQVLNESRPDPEFARRVVAEAMRRGEEALKLHAQGDAIHHYDEALAALENLEPGAEQQRLKMEALWKKGQASRFPLGQEAAVPLLRQSLTIAEALGDRKSEAEKLVGLALNVKEQEEARAYCQKALQLYRELEDVSGQAECLLWLGSQRFFAKDAAAGISYYEQALPLFERTEAFDYAAVCRGMLDLVAEVGAERFSTLALWNGCCTVLEQKDGVVRMAGQPGIMMVPGRDEAPQFPAALLIHGVFHQIGGPLRKFLDGSEPVGGGWAGDAFSFSYQPLRAAVTVKRAAERVTVPAGTWENCLLTELVIQESDLPDEAPERARELNRQFNCGTRWAWYAPGVGLVQLHVRKLDGTEALIQLREFTVQEASDAYLPLAIGNAWSYGWADAPAEWIAKEAYRVRARKENRWYLEQFSYLRHER